MPGEAGSDGAPVDEQARKEQARAERAAAAAAREQAAVFNEQLGVVIVNSLSRVKVDDRVVKILTAINIASDLDRIAMRGARYGFPGWVTVQETKRGSKRVYVEQRGDAKAKAAEYLAGAKSAGELAGRTLALLLMAVYADENAVAHSNRAFHSVSVETALPWADDVAELIDEIAGEKLPATLMDPILEQRRARHAECRAAAVAKAAAIDRIAELAPCVDELDTEVLDELEQLSVVAHGEYSIAAWELRDKIRARRKTLSEQAVGAADEPADATPPAQDAALQDDVDPLDVDAEHPQDGDDAAAAGVDELDAD